MACTSQLFFSLLHSSVLSPPSAALDMSYDDPLIDTMAAGPGPPSLRQLKRPPSPEPTPHRSRASTCNKTIFTTLTAPSKYDNVPLETKLLLQSRPQGYENITPQSQIRRITVANTGIQLDLCRLIWPQCVRAFRNERHRLWPYVLAYIFNTVLKGILPSAK